MRKSKPEAVRERRKRVPRQRRATSYGAIADLIGSVNGLPADLSTRKRKYLRTTGYGRKRSG